MIDRWRERRDREIDKGKKEGMERGEEDGGQCKESKHGREKRGK